MDPKEYLIAAALLPRLIGALYIIVFGSLLFQMKGLFGKNGILPIDDYLQYVKQRLGKKSYFYFPTIFWINASDNMLLGTMAAGILFGILLAFNVYPPLLLLPLYILHLSIVSAGQDFLSFGWETFLLEITFNTIFLSLTTEPNVFIWLSLNMILFRFYFQGGVSKLRSRDVNWRNLTAVAYHYQTQPIANATAWYVHKLPMWFHKLSTFMMFIIEIPVPFFVFATPLFRLIAFFSFTLLQLFIWATGNFSYLNHLSVILSVILISDKYWPAWFHQHLMPKVETTPLYLEIFVSIVGTVLLFIQIISLYHYFMRNRTFVKILSWFQPFHLGYPYGIFAVMTTKRYEIVVEGSMDGMEWHEYLFKHKPSEVNRRPRRISPLQPRLDWQAWFLPFSHFEREPWFQSFLLKLLEGSPEVLKLLRYNPFPNNPPVYIRALAYDYEFTNKEEKKKTGVWWRRKLVGLYAPRISLKDKY
jgi:lipase maturation factor 1